MAEPIKEFADEKWKPVVGWEGLYEVSDLGRVKAPVRMRRGPHGSTCTNAAHELRPKRDGEYVQVHLRHDGRSEYLYLHTIVLTAFRGPRPDGMQGCHEDGDKSNNRLTNLRWGTVVSNHADKVRHGTTNRGERHGNSRLTTEEVIEMRQLRAAGHTRESLAGRYGISPKTVWKIVTRKTWKHI